MAASKSIANLSKLRSISEAITNLHIRFRPNWALILLVPYLIAVTMFHLGPALIALVFSFSNFYAGKPQLFAAVFRNYVEVFTDEAFLKSYQNVIQFAVIATCTGFVGAVGVALLLSLTRDRVGTLARSVFFLPGSINSAALALVTIFMLDPLLSPFGFILRLFGWQAVNDFVNASNASIVMTVMRFYLSSGAWIAIFYSALESVPQELLEAARIDGCGAWRLAWHIRRPIIMGFVWFMVIQLVAQNIQIFGEPYLISQALGGSSFIDPFWSPNMVGAFYTQRLGNFGMSAVVSVSQVIISISSSVFIVTKTGAFITDVTS